MEYHSGAPIIVPEEPSPGELYYLSGRALVEELMARENFIAGRMQQHGVRYMPPESERKEIKRRMKSAGVTTRELCKVLGFSGNTIITKRLDGRSQWREGDMELIDKYLREREGT